MSDAVQVDDQTARAEKIARLSERVAHVLAGKKLEDKVSVLVTVLVNETIRSPLLFTIAGMVDHGVHLALEQLCGCDDCAKLRSKS